MLNIKLNSITLSDRWLVKIVLGLILFILFSFNFSCGKRKPPVPPSERVFQRVEIEGYQRGNQIHLKWLMPIRNAPNSSILNISSVIVYRLAEPFNSTQSLTEEEFAASSTVIANIKIQDSDFARKNSGYIDKLEFSGQKIRLRYAIRFVNESGSKAAFSNFLLIEPAARVAQSPTLLPIAVGQDQILLSWNPPSANVDGSKPANIIGFNVYRSQMTNVPAKLLNPNPVTANQFSDLNFEFGTNYQYFVRSVSIGTNAEPIESLESNIIQILPKDTFAPMAPTSITLAASPTTISIFFVANPESDLAGYKIFRSENQKDWESLTQDVLKTNTFQDTRVEKGKTYYYYLIAVDKFGNASDKSEIVNETVP